MRFGFLLKRGKPEARELAQTLVRVLAARGATSVVLPEDASALPDATVVPLGTGQGATPTTEVVSSWPNFPSR